MANCIVCIHVSRALTPNYEFGGNYRATQRVAIGTNIMLETSLILFFPFFMALAAASDLITMTISNKISVALMAGFMVFAFWMGMDWATIGWHWAMFALTLVIGFGLFAVGVLGGGDAKLIASTSLWLGWDYMLIYVVNFALLGGLLALIILRLRSIPIPERVENVDWISRLHRADTGVPYGIALGAAALITYPKTPWMQYVFESARLL